MPPKTRKGSSAVPKAPAFPVQPLNDIFAAIDLSDVQRKHPVFRLFQRTFREAASFNDEAKELVQEEFATRCPNTPKKRRDRENQIFQQIDELVLPEPLDFEQSIELFSSPAVTVPSASATTTPVTRKIQQSSSAVLHKQHYMNAVTPSGNKSANATPRILRGPVKPKKNYVPKAAIFSRKNPQEIDQKAKEDLQRAEERRLQQLAEKTERIRAEREDRDARARERRQQLEEEKKLAAAKGQQYKNHDYAPRNIFSPKKAKNAAKKDVVTPRQLQVPAKKANFTSSVSGSTTSMNTVVASPMLKRKTTSKDAAKVEPEPVRTIQQTAAGDLFEYHDFVNTDTDVATEELHYEVVDEEEALQISNACRGESSLFASFEQHEAEIQKVMPTEEDKTEEAVTEEKDDTLEEAVEADAEIEVQEEAEPEVEVQEEENPDIVEETEMFQLPPPPSNTAKQEPLDLSQNDYDANTKKKVKKEKVWLPSTAEDYNVADLESGDETDDENKPRKDIPKWAKPRQLKPAVLALESRLTIDERADLLGPISEPSLQSIFGKKFRNRPRRSSNQWSSPFSQPTPGFSRFPH